MRSHTHPILHCYSLTLYVLVSSLYHSAQAVRVDCGNERSEVARQAEHLRLQPRGYLIGDRHTDLAITVPKHAESRWLRFGVYNHPDQLLSLSGRVFDTQSHANDVGGL